MVFSSWIFNLNCYENVRNRLLYEETTPLTIPWLLLVNKGPKQQMGNKQNSYCCKFQQETEIGQTRNIHLKNVTILTLLLFKV